VIFLELVVGTSQVSSARRRNVGVDDELFEEELDGATVVVEDFHESGAHFMMGEGVFVGRKLGKHGLESVLHGIFRCRRGIRDDHLQKIVRSQRLAALRAVGIILEMLVGTVCAVNGINYAIKRR